MKQQETAAALLAEIQKEKQRLSKRLQHADETFTECENPARKKAIKAKEIERAKEIITDSEDKWITLENKDLAEKNRVFLQQPENVTQNTLTEYEEQAKSWKPLNTQQAGTTSEVQERNKNQAGKWKSLKYVAVWCCFLLLGAGFFAWQMNRQQQNLQAALTAEVEQLRQENEAALAAMATKVSDMTEKVEGVSAALTAAGDDVSTSAADSQQATAAKLKELNQELASLRESLAILQEKQGNS